MRALRLQNPDLMTFVDDDGNRTQADFTLIKGLEPADLDIAKKDRGFKVTVQVHVAVVMAIVDKGGRVKMGHSKLRVTGAGIEAMIKENEDQNPTASQNDAQ